jgi:putative intracellular protease/amidase
MESDLPVRLRPQKTLDQAPGAHIVVVRGRPPGMLAAMVNPATLEYVQAAAKSAHTVASVCTGALILASAGLQRESRHTRWAFASQLERLGAWYLRKRWVEDGKFICSEGVSAGIDRRSTWAPS